MNQQSAESSYLGLSLPELEGSIKQIAWAKDIRHKAITKLLCAEKIIGSEVIKCILESWNPYLVKCDWWIDNRVKIDNALRNKIDQLKTERTQPYPIQQWEPYSDEYAHKGEGGELVWKCQGLKNEVFPGRANPEDLAFNVFCKNPQTKQWEIWHYQVTL